jgi:hypothetical protein
MQNTNLHMMREIHFQFLCGPHRASRSLSNSSATLDVSCRRERERVSAHHVPIITLAQSAVLCSEPEQTLLSPASLTVTLPISSLYSQSIQYYQKAKGKKSSHCNRPWRPTALREVEAPTCCLDNRLTDGGKVVSPTRRPPFTSHEDSWYSFLSRS